MSADSLSSRIMVVVLILILFGLIVAGLLISSPLGFALLLLIGGGLFVGWNRFLKAMGKPTTQVLFRRHHRLSMGVLLLCLLLFPILFTLVFKQTYWIHVAALSGIYVCMALGLNIVVGLAGLLDLGYIAFYAIGAYSSALVSVHFEQWWVLWLMIPISMMAAGTFGVILGAPTLRLRGDYLAIVTLGFGEIIRIVLNNWNSVTNGPIGIAGIPYPRVFGFDFGKGINIAGAYFNETTLFYFLIVGLAFGIAGVARRLDRSRIGRAWRAIREDELAARSMGINTRNMKLLAFASGASFAGVSGLVFAHMSTFIEPNSFIFMESAFVLCMVVLGGMGSIPGVILGAILLTVLPEKFRDFQDYRMLVLGASLIVMMRLRPDGLLPRPRETAESLAAESP